jgi:hypothetical protein
MAVSGAATARRPALPRPGRGVLVVVVVQAAVLLALAPRYGPHRDELYFAAAGQRLAWGYPDQGWVTPALARLSTEVAGHELVALRIAPLLLMVTLTLVAAHAARVLGGTPAAATLTAACTACSAAVMANGHLLTTAAVDIVVWAGALVLVAQALVEDRPRLWVVAGVVAGIGLSNKLTVALLVGALLVAAFTSAPARRHLATPWPWLGGLLAIVIWLPNLGWQQAHGWPQRTLADDIAGEFGGLHGRLALLGELVVVGSPLLLLVWLAGLVALLRRSEWGEVRVLPAAFLLALGVLIVTGGKGYYLTGAVVPLLAAGCVVVCERCEGRRVALAGGVLVTSAVVTWPTVVPVLPVEQYADSRWRRFDDDQAETIGWPAYASQVRDVLEDLSAADREHAVVLTRNYAQAGALEWYDVPVAFYSGHNGWADWGPPPASAGPWIVVGGDEVVDDFVACELTGRVGDPWRVHNSEVGAGIWLCRRPVEEVDELWEQVRRLSA